MPCPIILGFFASAEMHGAVDNRINGRQVNEESTQLLKLFSFRTKFRGKQLLNLIASPRIMHQVVLVVHYFLI